MLAQLHSIIDREEYESIFEAVLPQIFTYTQYWRKEWKTKQNKGKLWLDNYVNIGAAEVDENARLRKKWHWTVKSYWVTLCQPDSQPVKKSLK